MNDFEMEVVNNDEVELTSSSTDKNNEDQRSKGFSKSTTSEEDDKGENDRKYSLGSLPEDWEVRKLEDDFRIEYGDEKKPKDLNDTEGYPLYGANGVIGRSNEYLFEDPVVAVTCRGATCGNVHLTEPKSWVTNNSLVLRKRREVNDYFLVRSQSVSFGIGVT